MMHSPSPTNFPRKRGHRDQPSRHDLPQAQYGAEYGSGYSQQPFIDGRYINPTQSPMFASRELAPQREGSIISNLSNSSSSSQQPPDNSKLPRATLEQKIQALDWFHACDGKSQQHTVNYFRDLGQFAITKSTLNRWVLNEAQLREAFKNLTLNNSKVYKTRPRFKDPEVNRCLEILYEQSCFENEPITERKLTARWTHFYKLYHQIPAESGDKLLPKSNGWLHHFKKKNSVKRELARKFYDDAELFKLRALDEEQERLRQILGPYRPDQIYEVDEVSFNAKPSFLSLNSSDNVPATDKVTVSLLANADGSSTFDPLVVSSTSTLKDSQIHNLCYQKNGLLTAEIFYKYISFIDSQLTTEAVLLLDHLHSHIIPTDNFKHIRLVYYSPNIAEPRYTYRPLDFGLKRMFKMLVKCIYLLQFRPHVHKMDIIAAIGHAVSVLRSHHYTVSSFYRSQLISQLEMGSDAVCNDSAKEDDLMKMLSDYRSRNLISRVFNRRCLQNTGEELDLEELLFPPDEEVDDVHFEDEEIVNFVRREFSEVADESEPEAGLAQSATIRKQYSGSHTNWFSLPDGETREPVDGFRMFYSNSENAAKFPDMTEQYYYKYFSADFPDGTKRRRLGSLEIDGHILTADIEKQYT
ncbi:hypothetical protein OGAPHI_007295 [Ogataea philodendri]|uniref:HTH CENPB-type domain-containing protein n=1 Tax=Ogataea philodendri TaxID=1378263 RepID=A0A9P8NUS5_9ASCO|nr:uncharacterized protein OGAPHI_007295 [Ogataea philodendri]KAH3660090.1 hypothetical protein OGAPHI_007295 [Ogataea philodendri]